VCGTVQVPVGEGYIRVEPQIEQSFLSMLGVAVGRVEGLLTW
jgi:hypothetical protein